MVLLIDNYDSFSYNLFQLFGSLGAEIRVIPDPYLALYPLIDRFMERE